MNVKIVMLGAASEYERLTLAAARSSPMEYLRGRSLRHHHVTTRAFHLSYDRADEVASRHGHDDAPTFAPLRLACQGRRGRRAAASISRDRRPRGAVLRARRLEHTPSLTERDGDG